MICPRCLKEKEFILMVSRRDRVTKICEECSEEELLLDDGVLELTDDLIERDSRIERIEPETIYPGEMKRDIMGFDTGEEL